MEANRKNPWRPRWNGEDVEIEYVFVTVKPNKEKPLFWYNYDCDISGNPNGHSTHEAIKVTTQRGETFIISNECGKGINKLRKGGYSNIGHASFDDDDIVRITTEELIEGVYSPFEYQGRFVEKEYAQKQSDRRKWQKENYPKEFERSEKLREMISKSPIYK